MLVRGVHQYAPRTIRLLPFIIVQDHRCSASTLPSDNVGGVSLDWQGLRPATAK